MMMEIVILMSIEFRVMMKAFLAFGDILSDLMKLVKLVLKYIEGWSIFENLKVKFLKNIFLNYFGVNKKLKVDLENNLFNFKLLKNLLMNAFSYVTLR